ncbi:peptidoglycan-binding domain-containing protein [Streptomyces johnsoniae]|uniref:Peptidoglycan-binding domain-containing protein n=1 Tax=Streptomyces johnsoniae TaxID=3075532 RepID=A0ABU2RZY8_9ACTN|nr:peptidoglycan-binding domain-containing protein [Streptomyces sp. DSM 41886]MDT0442328.1 peptidoglycan-binding domain-containing protein [Streptomyces sp. DSM 41886]
MTADWMPRDQILVPVTEAEHEAVRIAQRALDMEPTGIPDETLTTRLAGIQRLFRLPVSGVLDRDTAALLDRLRPPGTRE